MKTHSQSENTIFDQHQTTAYIKQGVCLLNELACTSLNEISRLLTMSISVISCPHHQHNSPLPSDAVFLRDLPRMFSTLTDSHIVAFLLSTSPFNFSLKPAFLGRPILNSEAKICVSTTSPMAGWLTKTSLWNTSLMHWWICVSCLGALCSTSSTIHSGWRLWDLQLLFGNW